MLQFEEDGVTLNGLTTSHTAEESRPDAAENSEDVATAPTTIHSMSSLDSECPGLTSGNLTINAPNGGQPTASASELEGSRVNDATACATAKEDVLQAGCTTHSSTSGQQAADDEDDDLSLEEIEVILLEAGFVPSGAYVDPRKRL
ncbi:hypothetical protein EW026_g3757 [Hermanssonia centrifuga]|uniref:Uncharacterized protein n=1 Tax=Hermanssonia centrifuga TaxID=98765 RepID=A0A4S4KJ81_9APHY|nr:hypothetical protein EW026_g3757 [Hermanssonia centrifuga]